MVDSKPLIPTGRELPSSTLRLLGDGLLNLFYPAGCLCCSLPVSRLQDRGVCASCWKAVLGLRTTGGHCPVCGLPYLSYGGESSHLCGRCTLHPPPYSGARSFGWYRAPLSQIIRALKFDGRSDLSGLLAPLMASAFVECWSPGEIDWIVPVPLHGKRIRERGFNQAALLAKKLSRLVGIPCPPGFLERVRATMPQVGLSDAERFRNVHGAFRCRPSHGVRGARCLLVDDVMTTGATVASASKALLDAGALRVAVLTVARAVVGSE